MFHHITSDLHFGHKNIIQYCNRPFSSVEEMNRCLVERYNSVVSHEQTVLWVGDAFFCRFHEAKTILSSMNGNKILVRGNHDRSIKSMLGIGFSEVCDQMHLSVAGHPIRVKHYPYDDVRFPEKAPIRIDGEMLIHGHTHSKTRVNGPMVHVGVDAWDYKPASFQEIETLVNNYWES